MKTYIKIFLLIALTGFFTNQLSAFQSTADVKTFCEMVNNDHGPFTAKNPSESNSGKLTFNQAHQYCNSVTSNSNSFVGIDSYDNLYEKCMCSLTPFTDEGGGGTSSCDAQSPITWMGACKADISSAQHLQSITVSHDENYNDGDNYYLGQGKFICRDGRWFLQNAESSCSRIPNICDPNNTEIQSWDVTYPSFAVGDSSLKCETNISERLLSGYLEAAYAKNDGAIELIDGYTMSQYEAMVNSEINFDARYFTPRSFKYLFCFDGKLNDELLKRMLQDDPNIGSDIVEYVNNPQCHYIPKDCSETVIEGVPSDIADQTCDIPLPNFRHRYIFGSSETENGGVFIADGTSSNPAIYMDDYHASVNATCRDGSWSVNDSNCFANPSCGELINERDGFEMRFPESGTVNIDNNNSIEDREDEAYAYFQSQCEGGDVLEWSNRIDRSDIDITGRNNIICGNWQGGEIYCDEDDWNTIESIAKNFINNYSEHDVNYVEISGECNNVGESYFGYDIEKVMEHQNEVSYYFEVYEKQCELVSSGTGLELQEDSFVGYFNTSGSTGAGQYRWQLTNSNGLERPNNSELNLFSEYAQILIQGAGNRITVSTKNQSRQYNCNADNNDEVRHEYYGDLAQRQNYLIATYQCRNRNQEGGTYYATMFCGTQTLEGTCNFGNSSNTPILMDDGRYRWNCESGLINRVCYSDNNRNEDDPPSDPPSDPDDFVWRATGVYVSQNCIRRPVPYDNIAGQSCGNHGEQVSVLRPATALCGDQFGNTPSCVANEEATCYEIYQCDY